VKAGTQVVANQIAVVPGGGEAAAKVVRDLQVKNQNARSLK